jgi:hypothetical protein
VTFLLDQKSYQKNQGLILSAEAAPIIKPFQGADSERVGFERCNELN